MLKQVRKDYRMNQDKKNIILGCPSIDNFKLFEHTIGNIKVDVTKTIILEKHIVCLTILGYNVLIQW